MGFIDTLHRLDEKVGLGPSEKGLSRQLEEYPAAYRRWEQLDESVRVETYLDAVMRAKPPADEGDIPLWLALLEIGQRAVSILLWFDVVLLVAIAVMARLEVSSGIVESALILALGGLVGTALGFRRYSKMRQALLRQLPKSWTQSSDVRR